MVACSIVALLVDPLVNALQRHRPRWISIVAVVFAALDAVGSVRGDDRDPEFTSAN